MSSQHGYKEMCSLFFQVGAMLNDSNLNDELLSILWFYINELTHIILNYVK